MSKSKSKCKNRIKSKYNPLFWFGAGAVTLSPKIYIKKSYYKSLNKIGKKALLVHEKVHCKQQVAYKSKKAWLFRYVTNKKFRLEQELEAYKKERTYYKKKGFHYSKINIAKALSSSSYFYMCSFEEALKRMQDWDED